MTLIADHETDGDDGNAVPESGTAPAAARGPVGRLLIRAKARTLPTGPGVYRMLDQHGDVMYVGKARNLKARVGQYASGKAHTNRVTRMIGRVHDLIVVTTETESQALLLEAQLIKRYMPPYNVLLRDDKSFPYILIRTDHQWPQIKKHRGAQNIRGHISARSRRPARSIRPSTRCSGRSCCARARTACSTPAPVPACSTRSSAARRPASAGSARRNYNGLLEDARQFLGRQSQRVQRTLSQQMMDASEAMEFERAAAIRDRIKALTSIQGRQGVTAGDVEDADVIAAHQEGGHSCVQVFFLRAGQNWGNRAYFPKHDASQGLEEVLEAFIGQFYDSRPRRRPS